MVYVGYIHCFTDQSEEDAITCVSNNRKDAWLELAALLSAMPEELENVKSVEVRYEIEPK